MNARGPHSEELSNMLVEAMIQKHLTLDEIAQEVGVVYETARRIINTGYPGEEPTMKAIAKMVGLDPRKVQNLAEETMVMYKYGDVVRRMKGIDPELEPLSALWKHMTDDQKHDLLELARTMAKRTRRLGAA